ncbi:zonular occludens toxin domain-containing protein [Pseudomonas sp. ML96]|uniref:zonular occludens toxin domain-containing protein n=1 Tax=Pseudomonas sp. ML96 TaxID=1523503 RepID=UPI0005BDD782|nr:zonular occludens toxin domain-containing protein [Pseudomonas sp. ML96]
MFVLRTGLQGNGKTLNTIKEVDLKAAREGRTVFYCNITGLNPGHPILKADWRPFDDPTKWFELPANSIIVIDEAQTWFRVRSQGSKVPDYASRLEIMRKDGHELHAITQSPKLIDAHMRELCNKHVHYHRGFGGKVIKRWEFQKPELTVNSNKLNFENGESIRITIDKAYFGTYESVKEGTAHHMKFTAPKAMYVLGACLLIGAVLVYRLKDRYDEKVAPAEPAAQVEQVAKVESGFGLPSIAGPELLHVTTEQYIADRTPRIAGVPSSAPIYDQLTAPQSFPKPSCYATKSEEIINTRRKSLKLGNRRGQLHGCSCLSQQGSRMDIPFDACMDMVENGYFDDTKPDRLPGATTGQGQLNASAPPSSSLPTRQPQQDRQPAQQPLAVGLTGLRGRYE